MKKPKNSVPKTEDAEELERSERERASGNLRERDPIYDSEGQMRFPFEDFPPITITNHKYNSRRQ